MLRSRVASLDGLRGLALVLVLGYHAAPSVFGGGFLGVDVFFVLSGYLIATVLLRERRSRGRIDARTYAVRRIRRIAPGLLVLLAGLVIAVPALAPESVHRLQRDVTWSALGLTNWHLIADSDSYFTRFAGPPFVRHLWSVAIEIQFYALCPFLVAWVARRPRRIATAALGAGIAASAILMAVLARRPDPSRAYFGTDTRIAALLVGVLVAVLIEVPRPGLHRRRSSFAATERWVGRLGVASLGLLLAFTVLVDERSPALYRGGFLLTEIATAVVIYASLRRGLVSRILSRPTLKWLGERSYGIYLWHWPLVVLLRPGTSADWPVANAALVSVAGALVLGDLSYRLVERPFLDGRRLRLPTPHRALGHASVLVSAVAVLITAAVLRAPSNDPLAVALQAGKQALAAQTRPAAAAASSPVTEVPAPAAPAPEAPPAPAEAPRLTTTVIGDSVVISAAGALRARLGESTWIDAEQGRHFINAPEVIRALRAKGELGRVVVIALGNNGPVTGEQIDAAMAELTDVERVLLVTARVWRNWQDSVNDTLKAAPARHPGLAIIDWWLASEGHPEWFQRDGTHFPTSEGAGANAYADVVTAAINPPAPAPPPPPPPATPPPPPATPPPQ